MSTTIEVFSIIDAPIAKVWHFYAVEHVQNHPRWDPDMHLAQISDGPIGVGTLIKRTNTHSGSPVEGTMEVVKFETENEFAVLIHDGPSRTVGRVTFKALNPEQTKLTIIADFEDIDEATADKLRELMKRSPRNIKRLIETE